MNFVWNAHLNAHVFPEDSNLSGHLNVFSVTKLGVNVVSVEVDM